MDREERISEQFDTERRAHDRSRLIVDVFFDGKDATGVASTRDISPGGLYMNTQAVLPEGVFLTLRIPLREERQVVVKGEVIYSNPGRGVGIRFRDVTDGVRSLLETELPLP